MSTPANANENLSRPRGMSSGRPPAPPVNAVPSHPPSRPPPSIAKNNGPPPPPVNAHPSNNSAPQQPQRPPSKSQPQQYKPPPPTLRHPIPADSQSYPQRQPQQPPQRQPQERPPQRPPPQPKQFPAQPHGTLRNSQFPAQPNGTLRNSQYGIAQPNYWYPNPVQQTPRALNASMIVEDEEPVGIRNRVYSPTFHTLNLRGSDGIRGSANLENTLMRSTDTFVNDYRDHPEALFTRIIEEFVAFHKKDSFNVLKIAKIPVIEKPDPNVRIQSFSSSQTIENPISVGADIYTAVAYGLFGDAFLGQYIRSTMVDTLRDIANWLEAEYRPDISKIVEHIILEDLPVLFKYLIPGEVNGTAPVAPADGAAAAGAGAGASVGASVGASTGASGGIAAGSGGISAGTPAEAGAPGSADAGAGADEPGASGSKGKKDKGTTEQGMVVEDEKKKKKKEKKRKGELSKDGARDHRYARALRSLSNDIINFDATDANYIHPITIVSFAAMLYKRPIHLFSVNVAQQQVKLQSVYPPTDCKQLPVYLACDDTNTSKIFMLVPSQELFSYDDSLLFFQRHATETVALVPAYNEGENEIMRTFMSFKKECREEVQVIFFVDGVLKNGSNVNHNTLQALLNNFDFVKMSNGAPMARYGKEDLLALVADVCTLGDTINETVEYVGQDRNDVVAHIGIRVWVKKHNSGKKQSQLKFFEYLGKRSIMPRYLLFVDSDTRFEHPAVSSLKTALDIANTGKPVPEIGGTTGEIVVENISGGYYILGATQYFEYKMSHHLGKRAESSFNRVSCLAGAFSMFECRALMDSRVISDFATADKDSSLWIYNKKNLGEDRYLTAQLLEAGYGTSFEPEALSYTVAPATLTGFIAQRRRWDNSTLVNQIDLIFAEKQSVFSLWGGRYTLPWVWNFIDFFFSLFMPGNMVLLLVSLINSILRLADNNQNVELTWIAPVVLTVLWLFFFVLPLISKHSNILALDIYLLKMVSGLVVLSTGLLFAYMYKTSQIWLMVIATWVFLGPYAFTLIIRQEVVCMACGPLFLLATPIMFLFMKFYALANFAERSWGTRDAAAAKATDKEESNIKVTIGGAGFVYLVINIGYMIVALLYPFYFMWVFVILVSVTAITRLVASLALSKPLSRYRRMLGTVGLFDGLFAVMCVVLFMMMLYFPLPDAEFNFKHKTYDAFLKGSEAAIFYVAIARSFIMVSWYLGMRRGGWIAFVICCILTVVEGILILALGVFNAYGLVMGIGGVGYTIAEGFLVWKTQNPIAEKKVADRTGLCCYLAFGHNMVLLIAAAIINFASVSNLKQVLDMRDEYGIPATIVVVPFAIICGVWMWALHLWRTPRSWVLVMHAIACNLLYMIILVIAGQVLVSKFMGSFSTGYFPYVAIVSMVCQLLLSWSGVRWAVRRKHDKRVIEEALANKAAVNTTTGSMWPIQAEV